jgi:hypothetical protein
MRQRKHKFIKSNIIGAVILACGIATVGLSIRSGIVTFKENRDSNTPYVKTVRVVTTVNYYLKN